MTEIVASNTPQYSSDVEVTSVSVDSLEKVKEITLTDSYTGSWRIVFDLRTNDGSTDGDAQIYKDGAPYGTYRTKWASSYDTYSEDFTSINVSVGAKIQLYLDTQSADNPAYARNFRIEFDEPSSVAFMVVD